MSSLVAGAPTAGTVAAVAVVALGGEGAVLGRRASTVVVRVDALLAPAPMLQHTATTGSHSLVLGMRLPQPDLGLDCLRFDLQDGLPDDDDLPRRRARRATDGGPQRPPSSSILDKN